MNIIISEKIGKSLNAKKSFSSEEFFREQLLKKIEKRKEEKEREKDKIIQALEQIKEIVDIINENGREEKESPITMTNLITKELERRLVMPPILRNIIAPIKLINIEKGDVLTFRIAESITPQDLKYYLIHFDGKEQIALYDEQKKVFFTNEEDFFFRDNRHMPSLNDTKILGDLVQITKNS